MPKPTLRLVLLFDGTDNTRKDRTNVWRTHELVAERGADRVLQLKQYIQGVGTELGELARGSLFGTGVSRKIREGYEWLVANYRDGAEIYVFGFSRGAFTARSLVQMVANCGLTRPSALGEWSVEQAFNRYESISLQKTERVTPLWRLRHWQKTPADAPPGWKPTRDDARLLDDTKVRMVKIRMAGLWDTVGAIGVDALHNRHANRGMSAAHNVRPTKAQEYGYHALAIDEHRPMFEATLWRTFIKTGDRTRTVDDYTPYYEQRWFVGAHSDVGGGYGDDDLPDLSLRWMMSKASKLGLTFTHAIEPRAGAWHDDIHDSYKSFAGGALTIWDKILPGNQRNYRVIGRDSKSFKTSRGDEGFLHSINETIDESVLLRLIEDPTYRPPGLIDYLRDRLAADKGSVEKMLAPLIPSADKKAGFPRLLVQRTQRIVANRYWNETGVYLRPGVRYRASVVPNVGEPLRDADYTARSIHGEQWKDIPHQTAAVMHGKRKDDANWFALIGTVDKEHGWALEDGGTFEVEVAGQLVCYFNDVELEWFYRNNSGWVVLEIEQQTGPSRASRRRR